MNNLSLIVDGNKMRVSGGCNSLFFSFTSDGFIFEARLIGSTKRFCKNDQDYLIAEAFETG